MLGLPQPPGAATWARVLAVGPDYLLSGHSHVASDAMIGGVPRINPGALHRADEYSVALLDLGTGEARFLPVTK